jgi:ABC-type transport system involved in multi-copper enzyme maturation permease subunit
MRGVAVIAGLTCREAARRRLLAVAAAIGTAYLVLYGFGLHKVLESLPAAATRQLLFRRQAVIVLFAMGMYVVNWLLAVITILTSADTVAGEINSGVIQAVVTKPIRRWEVILGKWLGFAAMLTVYLAFLAGGMLVEVRMIGGHTPAHVPQAIGLMWLESMLLLAITFRFGASLSTLATGVAVFGLHILAFLGGWVEEFGWLAHSQTAIDLGVLASVVMPSESLWRRAASELQGPVIGGFGRSPFSIGSVPSGWMVIYAGVYLAAALGLAIRRFSKRDL